MNSGQRLKTLAYGLVAFLAIVFVVALTGKVIGSTIGLFSIFAIVGLGALVGMIAAVPMNQMFKTTFQVKTYMVVFAVLTAMVICSIDGVTPILKNSTSAGEAMSRAAWSITDWVVKAILYVAMGGGVVMSFRHKKPWAVYTLIWFVTYSLFGFCANSVWAPNVPEFIFGAFVWAVGVGVVYLVFENRSKLASIE